MEVRTIKFSDIVNHPNISLSGKGYFEEVSIEVEKNLAKELQEFLDMEDVNMHELKLGKDSTIHTFTAKFSDGFEADIKVCSGNNNFFIDPVLFDEKGHQVCVLEAEFDLLGDYVFESDTKEYTVKLILER